MHKMRKKEYDTIAELDTRGTMCILELVGVSLGV